MLLSNSTARVQIGRLGEFELKPGYYIYIGSAFGPGGLRARISRHCRTDKPKYWHIDYLREFVTPLTAWVSYGPERLEHRWAQVFYRLEETIPVQGFGCSDCKCHSHLFYASNRPEFAHFSGMLGDQVEAWPCLLE